MPGLDPAPFAEEIDEQAARRSIRTTLIVMSAILVLPFLAGLLGFLIFGEVDDQRPAGVNDGIPAWAIALLVAAMAIPLAATVWWVRRQYRQPAYRRVMQYDWRRRRRVMKAVIRGRPVSAEDMPVARAMVDLQRSQGRWLVIVMCTLPLIFVFNGVIQPEPMRWFQFGVAAFTVVVLPFALRQRRKTIRNYERLLTDGKR